MRSSSSCLTIQCLYWSRKSTKEKELNGNSLTLVWIYSRLLNLLKRFYILLLFFHTFIIFNYSQLEYWHYWMNNVFFQRPPTNLLWKNYSLIMTNIRNSLCQKCDPNQTLLLCIMQAEWIIMQING